MCIFYDGIKREKNFLYVAGGRETMGMYMSYKEADHTEIEQMIFRCGRESEDSHDFCSASEQYEILEGKEEREVCYLGKMWDGLHCLLTKKNAKPMEKDLLGEAVYGGEAFSDEGVYFVSYILPERMPQILEAMDAFDLEAALSAFSPEYFEQEDIYPHIWNKEKKEDLKQELRQAFQILRDFYVRMINKNRGVIISLS